MPGGSSLSNSKRGVILAMSASFLGSLLALAGAYVSFTALPDNAFPKRPVAIGAGIGLGLSALFVIWVLKRSRRDVELRDPELKAMIMSLTSESTLPPEAIDVADVVTLSQADPKSSLSKRDSPQ